MKELFKTRIFCITENKAITFVSNQQNPTYCPVHHTHVIDPNKTFLIGKEYDSDDFTRIKEEEVPTQGLYRCEFINYEITSQSNVIITKKYDYPINIINLTCFASTEHVGDSINTYIVPDTPIGFISSNAVIGESNFYVNDTTMKYIKKGLIYTLQNNNSPYNSEELGEIVNINFDSNMITTKNYLSSNNFDAMCYSKIKGHAIKDLLVIKPCEISIGESKIGATFINSNMNLVLEYNNSNCQSKIFQVQVEYYY
jgi:hypothetical protein